MRSSLALSRRPERKEIEIQPTVLWLRPKTKVGQKKLHASLGSIARVRSALDRERGRRSCTYAASCRLGHPEPEGTTPWLSTSHSRQAFRKCLHQYPLGLVGASVPGLLSGSARNLPQHPHIARANASGQSATCPLEAERNHLAGFSGVPSSRPNSPPPRTSDAGPRHATSESAQPSRKNAQSKCA